MARLTEGREGEREEAPKKKPVADFSRKPEESPGRRIVGTQVMRTEMGAEVPLAAGRTSGKTMSGDVT